MYVARYDIVRDTIFLHKRSVHGGPLTLKTHLELSGR